MQLSILGWLQVPCFVVDRGWHQVVEQSNNLWSIYTNPAITLIDPVSRGCPQVSIVPDVVIGLKLTRILGLFAVVNAPQCMPPLGQGGCGLTALPAVAMGLKFTNTVGTPVKITPPAIFTSPTRCTDMINPLKFCFLLV